MKTKKENQEENQEFVNFGNVTFGEASKFLIDIIGQNVILDYISRNIKNEKEAEKKRKAYKQYIDRMYRGEAVYKNFAPAESESPQWYIDQFFKEILEKKYNFPCIAYIIIDSFTWQLFFALTWHTPFEKPKSETILFHIRKQVFCFIYHNLLKGKPLSDGSIYKVPPNSIINFLSDNFNNIISELRRKYKDNEKKKKQKTHGIESLIQNIFENKKTFHGKIEDFHVDNADKYSKLDVPSYRQNFHNWQNEKEKIDPTWKTLEPILDFLKENNETEIVCRLIGQYFLRNARKVLENVLYISQPEQEKIITDIVMMIIENRNPEEFYIENDFEFLEQKNLLWMCLVYQHQRKFDPVKSDEIITVIESKCHNSKKFFSPWLKARAKVFEIGEAIKENKEIKNLIINGYKKAYDEGIAYAGEYLGQFLLEAIIINRFCNPRQVKDINDYYGYGYALEMFGPKKQELLDLIKETDNLQMGFVNILYSNFNPTGKIVSIFFPFLHSIHEFQNEAILRNNKGLELDKSGSYELAIQYLTEALLLNPVYVNAYSNRGNVYSKMGEQFAEKALADFNMVLLLDPQHENTLFNRGSLFIERGQYEKAIKDFSDAININPEASDAYFGRGICFMHMKNFAFAIQDYNKAIELNPCYAEAYSNRGVIYKLLGDNDKAKEDYCKAKQIDPEFFLKNGTEFFSPNLF